MKAPQRIIKKQLSGFEWQQKVAKHEEHAAPPPIALFAQRIPEGFLGQIGIPDDQILREVDVGIKHGEGQHQHADVMKLAAADKSGNRGGRLSAKQRIS